MLTLKEISTNDFENFVETLKVESLYQTIYYGMTMEKSGFQVLYLGMVDEANTLKAATLILIEKIGKVKYAYAPRGFILDYNNVEILATFTKLIKKHLGKLDVIAVKLSPLIIRNVYNFEGKLIEQNPNYDTIFKNLKKLGYNHMGYNDFFEAHKPRFEAILDLDKPYYELFKEIKKEFRSKIRSAENNYIKVHKGNFNHLNYLYLQTKSKYPRDLDYFRNFYYYFYQAKKVDFFYTKLDTSLFLEKMRQDYQRQANISSELDAEIMNTEIGNKISLVNQKLSSDNLLSKYKKNMMAATDLLKTKPDGAITSSALVVRHNDIAYLVMDGNDTKLKGFNSKHLLLWKLIEQYSKQGFKKFNLGGMSNIFAPNNPYAGLNTFKMSFHAKVYEYIGDLELITNSTLYFMYQNSIPLKGIIKK